MPYNGDIGIKSRAFPNPHMMTSKKKNWGVGVHKLLLCTYCLHSIQVLQLMRKKLLLFWNAIFFFFLVKVSGKNVE